jgi:glycine cleavage system H protein
MKHYSKEHEWVEIVGGVATVGITSYAAKELGDVTFVEFPEIGSEFEQGDAMVVVESVKAAEDVFAPVSGKVIEVNEELTDNPELVNVSPAEEGWFCRLGGADEAELDNLLTHEEYQQYIEEVLAVHDEGDDDDDDDEE